MGSRKSKAPIPNSQSAAFMGRFLSKTSSSTPSSTPGSSSVNLCNITSQCHNPMSQEVDLDDLPSDPAKRRKISEYHPNQRDEIRRKYLIKGPCQPRGHDFPQKEIGNTLRRFNSKWFDKYPSWLEYSFQDDKAFCLCCYLFRDYFENRGGVMHL
ncbi:unnamed protein product [Cuscuta epithymum]|uniref:TTF-type domain-containing protein n=1 Tax=Cuscuta epithymum TaxID=186058 RepID=A0AAV0FRN4_9ASTE|nr:unnamed protein product [Cuscuta epithymum]